jgi:hypothetical protein
MTLAEQHKTTKNTTSLMFCFSHKTLKRPNNILYNREKYRNRKQLYRQTIYYHHDFQYYYIPFSVIHYASFD